MFSLIRASASTGTASPVTALRASNVEHLERVVVEARVASVADRHLRLRALGQLDAKPHVEGVGCVEERYGRPLRRGHAVVLLWIEPDEIMQRRRAVRAETTGWLRVAGNANGSGAAAALVRMSRP